MSCNIETKKQILTDIFEFVKKKSNEIISSFDRPRNVFTDLEIQDQEINIKILNILLIIFKESSKYNLDTIFESLEKYANHKISNSIRYNPMKILNDNLQEKLNENNKKNGEHNEVKEYKIWYYHNNLVKEHLVLEHFYVDCIIRIEERLLNYYDENIHIKNLYDYITDDECKYYKSIKEKLTNQESRSFNFDFIKNAQAEAAATAAAAFAANTRQDTTVETETTPLRQEPEAVAFTHLKAYFSEPKEKQVFMDNHPDKLFRTFKTNIQTVSSSSQNIKELFNNTGDFSQIYDKLKITKLSKKEKIKILFLCGFELTNEKQQRELNNIKTKMLKKKYFKILENYLENNKHMIAIGMFYGALDNPPMKNIKKKEIEKYTDIQLIKKNENFFISVTYGRVKHEIPLETQVIYLLHNVIMD